MRPFLTSLHNMMNHWHIKGNTFLDPTTIVFSKPLETSLDGFAQNDAFTAGFTAMRVLLAENISSEAMFRLLIKDARNAHEAILLEDLRTRTITTLKQTLNVF